MDTITSVVAGLVKCNKPGILYLVNYNVGGNTAKGKHMNENCLKRTSILSIRRSKIIYNKWYKQQK